MKIIKRGEGRQVTCGSCKSVLEHEDSDVFVMRIPGVRLDEYSYPEDSYGTYITCAVCKAPIRVKVSYAVKERIIEDQRRADHDC